MRRQGEMAARRERWSIIVERAGASRLAIRQFCQQHDVDEGQFYYWRRRLEQEAEAGKAGARPKAAPSFVLVQPARPVASSAASEAPAALELVLERGWRLRIPSPVDEAALSAVLKALGGPA